MSLNKNVIDSNFFLCRLCGQYIKTSAIKCSKCPCYLHVNCFENAAQVFDLEITGWQCRDCSRKYVKGLEIKILIKENECLRDQVRILTKVVSDQDYINCLQKQNLQEVSELLKYTVSCHSTNNFDNHFIKRNF